MANYLCMSVSNAESNYDLIKQKRTKMLNLGVLLSLQNYFFPLTNKRKTPKTCLLHLTSLGFRLKHKQDLKGNPITI